MIYLAAFLYVAGACKTMVDYEIAGLRMWAMLLLWPFVYVYFIAVSFYDG